MSPYLLLVIPTAIVAGGLTPRFFPQSALARWIRAAAAWLSPDEDCAP